MGRAQRGVKPMVDNPGMVVKRLLGYIFKDYGGLFALVFLMIITGVLANIQGTMFTKSLIDDYITPFLCPRNNRRFYTEQTDDHHLSGRSA